MIQSEQQFAEKLHAYTLLRMTPNSRVRDLIDMVLLIESGTLDPGRVVHALDATFGRCATHEVPEGLTSRPKEGRSPFAAMAAESGLELPLEEAFRNVMEFYARLRLRRGRVRNTI